MNSSFLSAPLWLVTSLHVITLTLHFMFMNFLVGGIIIVIWGKFNDRWNDPTVRKMIKLFPTAMALTVTLGVAPLLFVQLVYHRQVYSASIVSGWFWLMIVAAVIVAYYLLYGVSFSKKAGATTKGWLLTVALIGLLYVGYTYSSVFSLAERPDLAMAAYSHNQTGVLLNPDVADYLLRWLHMMIGAITVGGFFVGLLGRDNPPVQTLGRRFFLWGTVINALVGIAYLLLLGDHLTPFMRSAGIWYLTVGIVLALGTLHFYFRGRFAISGIVLLLAMVAMVLSRHYVRLVKLEGHWDPAAMPINPQWSVFTVFLLCFLLALAVVAYMVRSYFRDREQPA